MSSEYGWSDEQILDLSVRRLRQIVAAIRRRQLLRRREEISLFSWQTRQLASFTAAGYMTEKGKGNPALDAALRLAFDDIEAAQIEEAEMRSNNDGLVWGKDADGKDVVVEVVTQLPARLQSEASVLNAFGDPSKWRAR